MTTTQEQINVWNAAVPLVIQNIEEVGDEAKDPQWWRNFLKDHPQHGEIYANVVQELVLYQAMAETMIPTGANSISFVESDDQAVQVDLHTFTKSIVFEGQPDGIMI